MLACMILVLTDNSGEFRHIKGAFRMGKRRFARKLRQYEKDHTFLMDEQSETCGLRLPKKGSWPKH